MVATHTPSLSPALSRPLSLWFIASTNKSRLESRLNQVALDELGKQSLAQTGRAALDNDSGILESGDLGVGTTLTTADNGTGVTHTAAGGSADTGNEADGGLVVDVVGLEELGGVLFGATTDLTDHDDTVGLGVLEENLEAVDEVGTGEGVTTDTNDEGLTEAGLGGLVHGLVGKSTGTGDNTNTATLVDESGHDTDLALTLYHVEERLSFLTSREIPRAKIRESLTGAMIPGQLGPTRRVLFWVFRISVIRTMSVQIQSISDHKTAIWREV